NNSRASSVNITFGAQPDELIARYNGRIDTQQQASSAIPGRPAARVSAPSSRRRGPGSTAQGRLSRDRVLKAALELITEAGIDRVRLAEIARRAGMSSGQVMYYVTPKEHILLETLAWREQQDTVHRRAALAEVAGAWSQLDRYVDLCHPRRRPHQRADQSAAPSWAASSADTNWPRRRPGQDPPAESWNPQRIPGPPHPGRAAIPAPSPPPSPHP